MPGPRLNRNELDVRPLAERVNRQQIERDHLTPESVCAPLPKTVMSAVRRTADSIRQARADERPVVLAFGAHAIKNGLGPVLIRLLEAGWIQHLATNGAGIIHDWEFSFLGQTSEDVAHYVAQGQFGIWHETGFHLNLALLLGAWDGLGYGESVGRLINDEGHTIPDRGTLRQALRDTADGTGDPDRAAAAADLLSALDAQHLDAGPIEVPHGWRDYSAQAAAYRLGIPFTAHPMIGHDIIYTHPLNRCAAVGRTAERDFLTFAHTISQLQGGVYLSVGSAVMSPMIFEKSLSMARNLARRKGQALDDFLIAVVDLARSTWDWSQGEPPPTSPDYYLRYCKTFSRMGGSMQYVTLDNRHFLLSLCRELGVTSAGFAGMQFS